MQRRSNHSRSMMFRFHVFPWRFRYKTEKTRFQSIVTIIWIWSSIKNEDLKSNSSKKQSFLSRISFFRFFRKLKKTTNLWKERTTHSYYQDNYYLWKSTNWFFFKKTLDLDNLCYFKKKKMKFLPKILIEKL